MNIIRKYKLSKLKYYSLTSKESENLDILFYYIEYCKENYNLIDFIYNNFFDFIKIKLPLQHYKKHIFYYKKDYKYYIAYDLNNKYIFCFYIKYIIP